MASKAQVNPAYFQPGVIEAARLHGRMGKKGRTKHGHAGVHGRKGRHESPMTHHRDPFGHKGMGKSR